MADDGFSGHCARLDPHPPHEWLGRSWHGDYDGYVTPRVMRNCPGQVVTEGAAGCVDCGGPVAACGCYARTVERWEVAW